MGHYNGEHYTVFLVGKRNSLLIDEHFRDNFNGPYINGGISGGQKQVWQHHHHHHLINSLDSHKFKRGALQNNIPPPLGRDITTTAN